MIFYYLVSTSYGQGDIRTTEKQWVMSFLTWRFRQTPKYLHTICLQLLDRCNLAAFFGQFWPVFLDFHVFYVNRALCWGLIWHRASQKLYQGQMLWVKVMKLSQFFDFFYKKIKKMRYFGRLPNFKMLYLLNCWADSVQPVGLDCWNTVFFIPGSFIMSFLVICRLFACKCCKGIKFWPFLAIFGSFFWIFRYS